MVMVRLTESGGDGFAVWMDVFECENGEHQSRIIFRGPVD